VISAINLAALVYVLLVMVRKQNVTTTSIPVQPRMQGIQLRENEP
jgi:hypothetical protein